MDNTIFAKSIGTVRFLETKMLDRAKINAIADAKDFNEAVRLLQDTSYGGYIECEPYEDGLKKVLYDLYLYMYGITPVKAVIDILAIRYDGHNIKSLLKSKISGAEPSNMLLNTGTIPVSKLTDYIFNENYKDLNASLRKYIEKAVNDYKNSQDPQDIDINIDKGTFEYMREVSCTSGIDYLNSIVALLIDTINLKTFIRVKLQDKKRDFFQKVFLKGGKLDLDIFIKNYSDSIDNFTQRIYHTDYYNWLNDAILEYQKTNDIGFIEKYSDNFIINYLKKAKLISFGPEPLVSYILSKENEIKIVRILLTGKINNVSCDIIKGRLRDIYV